MRKIFTPENFGQENADAVIIGGGIIGVATAFWLSRAGMSTILVEMRDGLSTLTTTASIESFRAQFTEPAMAALAKESIEVWENFAQVTGLKGYEIDLHHGGYLFLTTEEQKVVDVKAAVEGYHKVGVTDSECLRPRRDPQALALAQPRGQSRRLPGQGRLVFRPRGDPGFCAGIRPCTILRAHAGTRN